MISELSVKNMLSQASRFSIGQQSSPTSPVQALRYSTLPNSPQTAVKHESEETVKLNSERQPRRYVFIPHKDDTARHRFRLRYSPCSDAYQREWDDCVLTRVGSNVRGWENGAYSFESVERVVDAKKNLVYLERTRGSSTGILTWKMDFSSCGLVIDQVSIKVASHNFNGGDVLVMLSSDETKKTISHMEGLGLVKVKDFENSKNLLLSIHLIGETPEQKTRLFEKNILSKGDFPLDVKVTLKPPLNMYNKPVILLGLMFSNSQETTVDRRHYRTHSNSSGKGFLHLNIVQGKNIKSANDTAPDAQVKCYLLPDEKNIKSCKTGRAKKSSAPVWDEYFVIDGVAQSELRKKQLGMRVVNWHLGINKTNSRLGELWIGCASIFDFRSLAIPKTNHVINLPEERSTNEGAIYSPLTCVDQERQMRSQGSNKEMNSKQHNCDILETAGAQNDSLFSEAKKTKELPDFSRDDEWPENTFDNVTVNDIQAKKSDSGHYSDTIKDKKIASYTSDDAQENVSSLPNGNGDKGDPGTSLKKTGVKPRRPPPPNLLKIKDKLHPESNDTSNQHSDDDKNLITPMSPRRGHHTPTLSRLMMKLPLSPRRGRRLSWGGESDLSLESPRNAKSPRDDENLESLQWDVMINRPKQWIYCWQSLEVDFLD